MTWAARPTRRRSPRRCSRACCWRPRTPAISCSIRFFGSGTTGAVARKPPPLFHRHRARSGLCRGGAASASRRSSRSPTRRSRPRRRKRSEPRVAFASVVEAGLVEPGEQVVDVQPPPFRPGARRRSDHGRAGRSARSTRSARWCRGCPPATAGRSGMSSATGGSRRSTTCAPTCARRCAQRRNRRSRFPSRPALRRGANRSPAKRTLRRRSPRCRARRKAGQDSRERDDRGRGRPRRRARRPASDGPAHRSGSAGRCRAHPAPPACANPRLGGVFRRKRSERLGVDIGRIGQNEVVALALQRREQIAFD